MNECMWVLLGFSAFVVVVLYLIYLCNLHSRVCRLERKASPRLEIIEREVHGIGCYMRILVGLAIFFCVCVCVHYISYCYPRYIPPEQTGFDYMGVIVGVMAAMITLLVGWQIFSNIKERERFDKLAEANDKFKNEINDFRDGADERLDKLDKCCKDRGEKIFNLANDVNTSLDKTMIVLNTHVADIYKIMFSGEDELGYEFRYLSYRLAAMQCADRLEDFYGCNVIVKDMNDFFDKTNNLTFTQRSKKDLIDDLLEIQHPEQIIDFGRLKANLERINVDPNAKGL